ncbi:gp53-like domain-containing protein [Pseudomonas putida]
MELLPGDTVTLVRVPGDGVWYALHGSVANRYSGAMKAAVWETLAQFDSSKALATTEFVQRALGSYSKYTTLNASVALSAAHVGALLVGSAALAGGTVTLPLSSSVPAGSVITISAGAGEFTLAKAAGDLDISIGLSSQSSLVIGVFESIILASTGSSWRAYSGSVPLKYHGSFSASLASNGYQKLPSGLIKQWGSISVSGAGVTAAVTFPIAFPNTNLHVVLSATGTPLVDQRAVTDSVLSNNGMNVAYYGSGSSSRIRWEAIGY